MKINGPGMAEGEQPLYLEVALNLELRRTLTYAAPAGLRVEPGARVLVPLRGREVPGFVVGVSREAPAGVEAGKILAVGRVLDERPLFDEKRLTLGRWLADYYSEPPGVVLDAMLPVSSRTRRMYGPGPAGPPLDLGGEVAEIFARLEEGPVNKRRLLRGLGKGAGAALDRLVRDGHLRAWDEAAAPPVAARENLAVRLTAEPPELGEFTKKSPAGARALAYLVSHTAGRDAVWAAEVCRLAGVGHSTLRALEKKKLVALFPADRLDERDPAPPPRHRLTDEQSLIFKKITAALGGYAAFLLDGVTGSGKTEVYLRATESCLAGGRGVIVLVPEIALTAQLMRLFRRWFGDQVALLHSRQGYAQRRTEWLRLLEGKARVAVGPRSAVFAPVRNLGLVVMDEEHEDAYKQQEQPRYHAREVAAKRCRLEGAVLVLGSATPSVWTAQLAKEGRLERLRLTERVDGAGFPTVQVVDMRGRPREELVPVELLEALGHEVGQGRQAIILLNRRGFATQLQCGACGYIPSCPGCGVPLVLHEPGGELHCHHCGHRDKRPKACPSCGDPEALVPFGAGTQRVERELVLRLPFARVARLDTDAATGAAGHEKVLSRFAAGQADILLGTQMVAKGLHFPRVTLVGVLRADAGLAVPDFRAAERTFTLLCQVIGRAGRGVWPGRAILAAYAPEHYAVRAAVLGDYDLFLAEELRQRRIGNWPPYVRLASLVFSAEHPDTARLAAEETRQSVLSALKDGGWDERSAQLLGPAPAPRQRLAGRWRFQLLLKASSGAALSLGVNTAARAAAGGAARLTVDVDPVSLV
ncbi:MAG TPA: primosomal protein N' [Candidatus Coatesbacteria bacterium]|nr:primosomal protein N' [Candidatus Coatesbacteria bacterium]